MAETNVCCWRLTRTKSGEHELIPAFNLAPSFLWLPCAEKVWYVFAFLTTPYICAPEKFGFEVRLWQLARVPQSSGEMLLIAVKWKVFIC